MASRLIICDLDRTTFMTDRFTAELVPALALVTGFEPQQFIDEMNLYYADGVGYDFDAHLAAYALSPAIIKHATVVHALGVSYLYPDVNSWLARHTHDEIEIVTVGQQAFQSAKLSFSPSLANFKATIVDHNKGAVLRDYLIEQSHHREVWIIDDSPITFEPLIGLTQIRQINLARPGEKYAGQACAGGVETITSLDNL
jgi:hypothetical protein